MERFEASTSPEYAMSADNAAADASRGDIAIKRLGSSELLLEKSRRLAY